MRTKKEKMTSKEPEHETDYCTIWKRASVKIEEDRFAAIELITVKELNREEIRFAYYKLDKNGNLRLIPRPLDVTYSEFNKLIKEAKEKKIID
ncbi:hypothetical protein J0K78_03110 [Halobacillus sp. GSS1]|uniref:Uncharacterized protein n=1 Tax=Halobacillus faecis TaxID=360184 RepID=A0A511WYT8_9BACI|nr:MULTISPECIES: hypothetical protein [Halobacillus]MBN9653242.1 hypothetical protein [Halobacillus sp. GSS1]GEN54932.1 hypothetical protein HFA01_31940 [Halobacillus faecis]